MKAEKLRVTLLQTDIVWEDKEENLHRLLQRLTELCGTTDLVILPETFSTGFTSQVQPLAEPMSGNTINTLLQAASLYKVALAGSFLAYEELPGQGHPLHYYNRAFFLTPDGRADYYDKRHLFRLGGEGEQFTAGCQRPIIHYRGWNILLQVCYDLRFPVWSRNQNNEYDLLIYVANWPVSRQKVWDVLLPARAIENQSYVCGVNRSGTDGNGIRYRGGSIVYSPKGECLASVAGDNEGTTTALIDKSALLHFRKKFPTWQDADIFTLSV